MCECMVYEHIITYIYIIIYDMIIYNMTIYNMIIYIYAYVSHNFMVSSVAWLSGEVKMGLER